MVIFQRPPHVQAMLMVDCHQNYKSALKIANDNIRLYLHHDFPAAAWWKQVKRELLKMQRNHMQTECAYYKAVTGELDETTC